MKKIIITGGSGFVGQQCLRLLQTRDFEIHALSSSPKKNEAEINWHNVDLCDHAATRLLLNDIGASHILHLAWRPAHSGFWNARDNLEWVAATLNLMRAFQNSGGMRAVGVGSCAEYSWDHGICVEDETPTLSNTYYGVCKNALNQLLQGGLSQDDFYFAWARIFFVYGPGEHSSRLVTHVIKSLLNGETAECTHGRQVRDYMHVSDVADGLLHLLDSKVEGSYNLATGRPTTLKEIINIIGDEIGRKDLVKLGARPAAAFEPEAIVGSTDKMFNTLDWSPSVDLREGVKQTIEWWRAELNS